MNQMILITSLVCLLFIVSGTSASPDIHFSYNSPSSWENIIRYGDTSITEGILQLTSPKESCGWATYNNNIPLVDSATGDLTSFITHFSFIMDSKYNGHGLAFFISSSTQPLSKCGGNLGLFPVDNYTGKPQNQMVAVEFDNYGNLWDPRFDHVGIDVNNIYSAVVYQCDNMANGTLAHAWVNYNAGDQTLNVSLNYHGSELPDHPILSHKINLAQLLPAAVKVGFKVGFSAANYYDQVHQILSWEFNSSTLKSHSTSPKPKTTVVLIAALCSIGVVFLLGGVGWFLVRRQKQSRTEGVNLNQFPKKFSYKELVIATLNFAPENKLGEGGFGPVYKGYLRECSYEVAVKLLKPGAGQGIKQFNSEVEILSKLRHPNLVELFGWCEENNQFLLVYKYMPNGSLNSLLSDVRRLLLWSTRYTIVLNLADALCYLQVDNEFHKEVIHRDIKPDNVLLDSKLEAKLSDFGLARPVDHGISVQTTTLAGSWGYVAPELITGNGTSKPSTQSDIYSFGVVLLEIACGRRNVGIDLIRFVWENYCRNELLKVADERLKGDYNAKEMERVLFVGLCVLIRLPPNDQPSGLREKFSSLRIVNCPSCTTM